ncbi:MAG: HI0074 family nucleotidyltransferase substrate-binding subunit [Alphaproteobacteria bacterium]|nr:HI0074 family nucleotidyltransferase substrate-binding subunit [Alphaproteobacteria bacterium]
MIDVKHFEFYYKLRTLDFIQEIWLFGSRAKGDELERSDIDLAVICPEATADDWLRVREVVDHADTLLKIDCIRYDQIQDDRLKLEIDKNRVVLFKRVKAGFPWYNTFLDLGEVIEKFQMVLEIDRVQFPFAVEASIQVFEYTFELYWKVLKKICLQEGVEVNSPRATLQQAYAIKLIDDENFWLEMMENRNLTSHTYRQSAANEIYRKCKTYLPIYQQTYLSLKKRYGL